MEQRTNKRLLAVIGKPIGHSRSPLMHNTALKALGLEYEYTAVEIDPANLERDIHTMVQNGFVGFSVTIPHKQSIIPLLETVDDEARSIGAVNTVVVRNGALHGYNTDVYGFRVSLASHNKSIQGMNVVLLGAGGAARAVLYCIMRDFQPARITIAARYVERAKELADSFAKGAAIEICSFTDTALQRAIEQAALIVNATPVGMTPRTDASPLPATAPFHRGQVVFDLIYTPLETTLLKIAAAKGATTINGLEMLLQQGARAFELWTGHAMPVDVVRNVLLQALNKK